MQTDRKFNYSIEDRLFNACLKSLSTGSNTNTSSGTSDLAQILVKWDNIGRLKPKCTEI